MRRSNAECVLSAFIAASLSGIAFGQHDFVETDLPCGARCAVGAIALFAEDGRIPQMDRELLQAFRESGQSLPGIERVLRQYGVSATMLSDVAVLDFRPTPIEPAIVQLTAEWSKRGLPEAGLAGVVYPQENSPHFVLAMKREGTALVIWDVTVGDELIPLEELEPYFTGRVLTLRPQPFWLRTAYEMAARRDLVIGGGIVLLIGAGILVFQLRRASRAKPQ